MVSKVESAQDELRRRIKLGELHFSFVNASAEFTFQPVDKEAVYPS
ncbi:MAG: hypothetical protein WBE75_03235 [Candidatus Omnitrophota bacterium]